MSNKKEDLVRWADWKQRQAELADKAEFFDVMHRPGTAEWIRLLSEKVAIHTPRNMLVNYFDETFKAWQTDFSGDNYPRRLKAVTVTGIILSSIVTGKLNEEMQTVMPILRQIRDNLNNLAPLGEAFLPYRTRQDPKMQFFGMCYHYPLYVEGVFDESIRLLFLLVSSVKGRSISHKEIEKMTLRQLRKEFEEAGLGSVFFEGWENRVRNSIAHARFRYDEKRRVMNFLDIDPRGELPNYSRTFTLDEFGELESQLSDVYIIIQDVVFLSRVNQLVLAPFVPRLGEFLLMPDVRKGLEEGILLDPYARLS